MVLIFGLIDVPGCLIEIGLLFILTLRSTLYLSNPLYTLMRTLVFLFLQMPPRTKQKAVKTPKVTRENYVPPTHHCAPPSYPWPREQEGEPIKIDDPQLLDFNCEGWDKESAARYNRLLSAEILPTRFGDKGTFAALGLETDVFETLQAMGIAPLCFQTHELCWGQKRS